MRAAMSHVCAPRACACPDACVQFWNYVLGMTRLRAITSCGKAQRAGLPVYFDMTHAYSVIGWARMRDYAVTRLAAPIEAKEAHFALLMLVAVFLSGAVLYQVIFLGMPVSRLDVVMELVALLYVFVFLLQVRTTPGVLWHERV